MSNLLKFNTPAGLFYPFHTLFDEASDQHFFSKAELGTTVPAVNIHEGIKHYAIELAIPGYKKEDIQVEIDKNNMMSISGHAKEEREETEKVTRKEFSFTSFKRSFNLPDDIDKQGLNAAYEQGILSIHIPKLDKLHPTESTRIIDVK